MSGGFFMRLQRLRGISKKSSNFREPIAALCVLVFRGSENQCIACDKNNLTRFFANEPNDVLPKTRFSPRTPDGSTVDRLPGEYADRLSVAHVTPGLF